MCKQTPDCGCDIGACSCPCAECSQRRNLIQRLLRLHMLEHRLRKADIDIGDLADLVARNIPESAIHELEWASISPAIEQQIELLLRARVDERLQDLTLISKVQYAP